MNVMFILLARRAFSDVLKGVNSKVCHLLRSRAQTLFLSLWRMPLPYSLQFCMHLEGN